MHNLYGNFCTGGRILYEELQFFLEFFVEESHPQGPYSKLFTSIFLYANTIFLRQSEVVMGHSSLLVSVAKRQSYVF